MSKAYAIVQNNIVVNIEMLEHPTHTSNIGEVIEIPGLISNKHVEIGWNYDGVNFIPPVEVTPTIPVDLSAQANQLVADLIQEEAIARYLLKLNIIKELPMSLGVTKL